MNVYFLVPGEGGSPSGGFRIIYEHADRLAARGHHIEIWHYFRFGQDPLRQQLKGIWLFLKAMLRPGHRLDWFNLSAAVRRRYFLSNRIPATTDQDRIVATYFKTHDLLSREMLDRGNCFYFIQGFETQWADPEHLAAQWQSGSRNIVISKHLYTLVNALANDTRLVPNALDTDFFRDLELRANDGFPAVLFLSLKNPAKGSADAVNAFNALHEAGKDFELLCFGNTDPRQFGLRVPCEFHLNPSQETIRELYNRAHILVAPSHSEGWGLPLAEATSCGAAILASDAEGHFEFLEPGTSALFFPHGDSQAMARALSKMLDDQELRERLIRNAKRNLAPYNWVNATEQMLSALDIATAADEA